MKLAYACPTNVFFDLYNKSKKGYMEMSENFYFEIVFFVLSASISHYFPALFSA